MDYLGFRVINAFMSKTPKGFYDPVKGHTGIDLNMPEGTAISLPFEVKVAQFLKQSEMGNTLYLKDNAGNVLVFAHLKDVLVRTNDTIKAGSTFAHSGNTGSTTTGPHLHFEIIAKEPEAGAEHMTRELGGFSGYNIDPGAYLDSVTVPTWHKLDWMKEHGFITIDKDPSTPVTWGEFSVVLYRLVKKVLEWVRNP